MFGPSCFDLWIYHRHDVEPHYLLLRTSQEKADRWFGGGRFWEVASDFLQEGESTLAAIRRLMSDLELRPLVIGTSGYVYTTYNRRFDSLQVVPVFAAEVATARDVPLTWEHSESGWFTAADCLDRINARGLRDGLARTREHLSEVAVPRHEFHLG